MVHLIKYPDLLLRKWIEVKDQNKGSGYDSSKEIRFKASTLRSDLCDYSDAYVVVKGTISLTNLGSRTNIGDKKNRPLALKNNVPFISCISKINGELIENAEVLDIVMPMYNLLEYSKNYRKTTGSLFNYYRDELADETDDNDNPNKKVINSESFKYKTGITGNTYNVTTTSDGYNRNKEDKKGVENNISLKYLGNFWRNLDMPLIN